MEKRILVVENDLAICQEIQEYMQNDLTKVHTIASGKDALANFIKCEYCLVVLDVQIPDIDIMEVLQMMRHLRHTPILLLTDPLYSGKIVNFFHAGADAYITKPLDMEVCTAQANALIDLYVNTDVEREQHSPVIHGSALIISPHYRQVMVNGKSLELTKKEFDLLHYFAKHPEQVFSWRQLYKQVWNEEPTLEDNHTMKVHIKNIRKKLSDAGSECIHNVWGVGYKFSITSQPDVM